jgi:hypothetical protein
MCTVYEDNDDEYSDEDTDD